MISLHDVIQNIFDHYKINYGEHNFKVVTDNITHNCFIMATKNSSESLSHYIKTNHTKEFPLTSLKSRFDEIGSFVRKEQTKFKRALA